MNSPLLLLAAIPCALGCSSLDKLACQHIGGEPSTCTGSGIVPSILMCESPVAPDGFVV